MNFTVYCRNQITKLRKGQGSLIPHIRDRITPLKLVQYNPYSMGCSVVWII